jgi:hypothetical protein
LTREYIMNDRDLIYFFENLTNEVSSDLKIMIVKFLLSFIFQYVVIDNRRNVIKADLGLVKKGQFPMALVENAHRFVIFVI